ncbi:hypothetical protein NEFER03_0110 [Nematocida sp. LUAm3]|nr:hypothetical protein NEFER03_0110 [Nematocida sp. LUAm3]KAI5173563.1 hypothetical protein NEFER02_0079 [Nematocida sp. LUAm2]KAI5176784.1 hypothetical protein NEFER01_0109 [Nematocida sp. LUAm1]
MVKEMKRTEDALRKIRVDFPSALQGVYQPGPVLQEVLSSERKEGEFFDSLEMLSRGIPPLIDANSDALKDSAISYHAVHRRIRDSYEYMVGAEEKVTHLVSSLSSSRVTYLLDRLKEEVKTVKKEEKERKIKEALSVEGFSIKEIHCGRVKIIKENLKRVSSSFTRSEIKKRTESELWRVMREIEKKIERSIRKGDRVSSVKIEAYRICGGSFLDFLYKSVKNFIIEKINKISEDIRESLYMERKMEAKKEKEIVSSFLSDFLIFHSTLLKRTLSLLLASREPIEKMEVEGFSHNPVIYKEIELGEEHSSHSKISLPDASDTYSEDNIISLFIDWPKKFLNDLKGKKKEKEKYDISVMARSPDSTRLYSEMFSGKYGGDKVSSLDEGILHTYTKHVYRVSEEETHLVIHGISLILAKETKKTLLEYSPNKENRSDILKDNEISEYFSKKQKSLSEEIKKATEKTKSEHKNSFLEKYVTRIKKLLLELEEFSNMSAEGLFSYFLEVSQNSFKEIFQSIDQVTDLLLQTQSQDLKPINYSTDQKDQNLIKEIKKWNHPNLQDATGSSLFLKASDTFYGSLSSFLLLRISTESLYTSTLSKMNEVTPPNSPTLTYKHPNQQVEGYFISHVLSLTRTVLEQLIGNGEVTETRLFHFLDSSSYLTKISSSPLLIYSSLFLFLKIKKCAVLTRNSSFKRNISILQTKLDILLPHLSHQYTYAPEYIFYAVDAISTGDTIYLRGLQRIFNCPDVDHALSEYHRTLRHTNTP